MSVFNSTDALVVVYEYGVSVHGAEIKLTTLSFPCTLCVTLLLKNMIEAYRLTLVCSVCL